MTFEDLVYQRLTGHEGMQGILADYAGKPAVFLQQAPDDTGSGWGPGAKMYPRCEYLVDMTADPARHTNGVITVHIYSSQEGTPPEEVVPYVRESLQDVLLMAEGRTYAAVWNRTELFELEKNKDPGTLVNGATVTFLLAAFPSQATITPDPAAGLEEFLKALEPEAYVIGKDPAVDVYVPTGEKPAFYVRVNSFRTESETFALRWVECTAKIHVIAPDPESRVPWVRYIADSLMLAGKVILLDGSPMLVREVEADNGADYLLNGQVTLQALYSIPVFGKYAHPVRKAYMND